MDSLRRVFNVISISAELSNSLHLCYLAEEAISKHGVENVKVYQTSFTGLFHAMTEHKTNTTMKLICLGKEEKVGPILSYYYGPEIHTVTHTAITRCNQMVVPLPLYSVKKEWLYKVLECS